MPSDEVAASPKGRSHPRVLELDDRTGEGEPGEEHEAGHDQQNQTDGGPEPDQDVDRDQASVAEMPRDE